MLVVALGCSYPKPPPSLNPLPSPETGSDIFTDYVADCSDSFVIDQAPKATRWVQGCLDFDGGYDTCLVKGADYYTKDSIVCAVVDLNVRWQIEAAKNTASDVQIANANHANDWIRRHRVGARR